MFTLSDIHTTHSKVKSGADFPAYVQEMKALGVERYDVYVSDGRSIYYGADDFTLEGPAKYATLQVPDTASKDALQHALAVHQAGQTDYPTFCRQAAEAGVDKWEVHMAKLTCTYTDKVGGVMVVENIPVPETA